MIILQFLVRSHCGWFIIRVSVKDGVFLLVIDPFRIF